MILGAGCVNLLILRVSVLRRSGIAGAVTPTCSSVDRPGVGVVRQQDQDRAREEIRTRARTRAAQAACKASRGSPAVRDERSEIEGQALLNCIVGSEQYKCFDCYILSIYGENSSREHSQCKCLNRPKKNTILDGYKTTTLCIHIYIGAVASRCVYGLHLRWPCPAAPLFALLPPAARRTSSLRPHPPSTAVQP
jgi:hypothetical protein